MNKYTPGPWIVDDANSELVARFVDGKYEYICDCDVSQWAKTQSTQEEREANAQLIATVPDLLIAAMLVAEGSALSVGTTPLRMQILCDAIKKATK